MLHTPVVAETTCDGRRKVTKAQLVRLHEEMRRLSVAGSDTRNIGRLLDDRFDEFRAEVFRHEEHLQSNFTKGSFAVYVIEHAFEIDPRFNRPIVMYVGATGSIGRLRRWSNRNREITALANEGLLHSPRIIAGRLTWEEAHRLERETIAFYGRRIDGGTLTNKALGGVGVEHLAAIAAWSLAV
jgi:hypothetical protein